jgi:thiol-disulfide isomerase/thioredoxin
MLVIERRQWAIIAVAAGLGLAAGSYFGLSRAPGSFGRPAQSAIDALYATTLPDLETRPQRIAQWKDRVLVVNFWATWCPPCREEIPGLIRAQSRSSAKNVQIVGIALDAQDKVVEFAKSVGINYPVVIGGLEAISLTEMLGNKTGALPYTVFISPGGKQAKTHLGMVSEAQVDRLIAEMADSTKP